MSSIISGFSGSVFPAIPMPVIIPGFFGIVTSRGRSLEQFPIQALGNRSSFLNWHLTPGVGVKSYSFIRCTNYSFMNFIYYLHSMARRSLLVAHLYYFALFFCSLNQQFVFIHVVTARFFNIYIFPGI